MSDPKVVIKVLKSIGQLDIIVGPSGYGLPLTHINNINDRELFLISLMRRDDPKTKMLGLREVILKLKEEEFNVYFIPGVIHMPTVPSYRKINKIDMGTADKLCCAILGVFDQSRHYNIKYDQTSFIIVEIGYGYNSILGVKKGQIVDGIGGTCGSMGFLSPGAIDGELAYLLDISNKDILRQGGVAYVAGNDKVTPTNFSEKVPYIEKYNLAWQSFMEGIQKGAAQINISVSDPREILLSGRLCRVKRIYTELFKRLSHFGKVRRIEGFTQVSKEAAQGAALLADGLAGGKYKGLVDTMRIKEAKGTVLDYIHLKGIQELKSSYGI